MTVSNYPTQNSVKGRCRFRFSYDGYTRFLHLRLEVSSHRFSLASHSISIRVRIENPHRDKYYPFWIVFSVISIPIASELVHNKIIILPRIIFNFAK